MEEEEEHIGCLKTFWFPYLIFRTTRSVVDNENTRWWMVHNVYHFERYYAECPCYPYIYSLLTRAFTSLDTNGGRLIHIVASSIRCHTHAGFLPLQVVTSWVLKRQKSSTCFSLIRCTYELDCHCPLTCLIIISIDFSDSQQRASLKNVWCLFFRDSPMGNCHIQAAIFQLFAFSSANEGVGGRG